MAPLVSIIVPVYKVEEYLHQCVDSIINQTYRNLEIILIDDGSPDRCPEICDEYAARDNRIKVIHKFNGGLSEARNHGLELASGEYIMFVDSDDYVDIRIVETLIEAIDASSADIAMCGRNDMRTTSISSNCNFESDVVLDKKSLMALILRDKIGSQAWAKLFKKEQFKNLRFPIGRLYEDIGTTYLAFNKCNRMVYISRPLYYYRLNQSSISFSEKPNKIYDTFCSFNERLQFAEANYPEVKDDCLALAFGTAMGSLHYHLRFGFAEEIPNLPLVKAFLRERKDSILVCPSISKSRKLLFCLFLLNEKLYNQLIKIGIKILSVWTKFQLLCRFTIRPIIFRRQ